MADPLDINLSPKALKSTLKKALDNVEDYGVFYQNPKYPNRRSFSGEVEVKVGDSVSIKWNPKLKEGYIDVEGAKGASTKSLKADFDKVRAALPKGRFGLNPGDATNAAGETVGRKHLKHKMYKRWFKNDPQVSLNVDPELAARPGGSIEGFTLDTSKRKRSTLAMKAKNKVTELLNPVSRPSGPKADKFFKEQKAYWEKHGKSSGEYFLHEGQRWRLDRKSERKEIAAGKPVRYSFKSVEEKLSGSKKATTQRELGLKNTTLDPKASQQFHTLIPAEKGFESSPRHHAAAARTVDKLHQQFERNLNPKWKPKDGVTPAGKKFLRNIQNRLGITTGDSPANIRVYKSDRPGSKRSQLHTEAHRLGADLGIDPQKVKFKGMNNAELWDYAKNTLAPAVKKIDKEMGYTSPYKGAGDSGAALRGVIPKKGGALQQGKVISKSKPRITAKGVVKGGLGGIALASQFILSGETATLIREGKYKEARESYIRDITGSPQGHALGGAMGAANRLLATKAGQKLARRGMLRLVGKVGTRIAAKAGASALGGPVAPLILAGLLAKDIYDVTNILTDNKFRIKPNSEFTTKELVKNANRLKLSSI